MQFFSRLALAASAALVCGLALVQPAHAQELVTNGGFETGDFTGYVVNANATFVSTAFGNRPPHSGTYFAALGDTTDDGGTVSQDLATVAGQMYNISFYLLSDGALPNSFSADFGSTRLLSLDSTTDTRPNYIFYSFTAAANSNLTTLLFTERNVPAYFALDDISVTAAGATAVPEPSEYAATGVLFGGLGIGLIRGRKRRKTA